jgi:pimeloyl-ACP methyl ester carboxylesterase
MPYFTTDHHRLFYREQGSGPLLLILHGNTASSGHHAGELEYFGRRYHAVAPDFRGCGQSDRMDAWPVDWWAQNGRDAAALVSHLGQERALVMGTSGGGLSALWMAIQHPERVQAVIADSCVERLSAEWCAGLLAERNQRTEGQLGFWRHGHGQDWERVVDADSDLLQRFAQEGGDSFNGRLAEIRCPVLFTASLRDELLQNTGQQVCGMAMQVKGSRVFFTDEGAHPLMWSRPADFQLVADCFLDSLA